TASPLSGAGTGAGMGTATTLAGGGGAAGAGGAGAGPGAAGTGGAPGAGTAGSGPGEPKKVASAGVPSRTDPFQYNPELGGLYRDMRPLFTEPIILPPRHTEQWYELYKPPIGTAQGEEDVVPTAPVPPMRVAGIHAGNVVSAMLEVQGQIQGPLVPGSKVLNEFR